MGYEKTKKGPAKKTHERRLNVNASCLHGRLRRTIIKKKKKKSGREWGPGMGGGGNKALRLRRSHFRIQLERLVKPRGGLIFNTIQRDDSFFNTYDTRTSFQGKRRKKPRSVLTCHWVGLGWNKVYSKGGLI